MSDDQIENSLDELAAQTVKRFCPQCGEAIVQNLRGRPKVFCSDRCRYAWKEDNFDVESELNCSILTTS